MGIEIQELMLAVEDKFRITIYHPDRLSTVSLLCDQVGQQLRTRGEPVDSNELFEEIQTIIAKQSQVPREMILRESHLVSDLFMGL